MPDFELRDLRENHAQISTKMPIKCLYTLTIATLTTIFIIQSSLQTVPNFIGKYSNSNKGYSGSQLRKLKRDHPSYRTRRGKCYIFQWPTDHKIGRLTQLTHGKRYKSPLIILIHNLRNPFYWFFMKNIYLEFLFVLLGFSIFSSMRRKNCWAITGTVPVWQAYSMVHSCPRKFHI